VPQEIELTPAAIAQAVGGELVGPVGIRRLSGFSFDTRTLAPGDVFFAIRGARDGNAFVADAVAKGAAAAVVSDRALAGSPQLAGTPLVVVGDALEALQSLARYVRRASGAAVVAVTGSAGKSTTKEITAELLSARYRVFRYKGNLNYHIGLPLSVLELRRTPDIGVLELGM
jgi:UDP-N-acetylmuramoyl-tripeptide--D-alanyl-D-alanine ligase